MLHLMSLGLTQFNPIARFNLGNVGERVTLAYGGVSHSIVLPDHGSFVIGNSASTATGNELFRISGATPNEQYREAVVRWLRKLGATIEETPIKSE
jgi:hypothetical protein